VYMLNKPIEKIIYDESGKFVGVQSEGEIAKAKQVIADPSYFPDKVKKEGEVARCIVFLKAPIPNTNNADSAQIILPASQLKGRKNDLYVSMVSFQHQVVPKNMYVACVSGIVETKEPERELQPALDLLGKIDKKFFWVSDLLVATNDPTKDQVYITKSYDPSSHFEAATTEVIQLYERITGQKLDLTISADPDDLKDDGSADAEAAQAAADAAEASAQAAADRAKEMREAEEALAKATIGGETPTGGAPAS